MRSAFAGKAVVDPVAGTVTLRDDPRVVDGDIEIQGRGQIFVIHKGDRRFETLPDPDYSAPADEVKGRSRISLGQLPDLGFSLDEDEISSIAAAVGPLGGGASSATNRAVVLLIFLSSAVHSEQLRSLFR